MPVVFSLMILLLMPSDALAQAPRIERIDVVEHGIYTADKTGCQRDEQGIERCARSNIRHAATTWTVPAQLGVEFGLKYRVAGTPAGAPIKIKRVWLLPAPGFQRPGATEAIRRLERVDSTTVGKTEFAEYGFDDSWELITGPWVLEFWNGNSKIHAQTFDVVKQ